MGQRHGSAWCARCKEQVLTISDGPANVVHGMIVLAGVVLWWPLALWVVPWALAAVVRRPERCTKCGGDIRQIEKASRWKAKRDAKAAAKARKAAEAGAAPQLQAQDLERPGRPPA